MAVVESESNLWLELRGVEGDNEVLREIDDGGEEAGDANNGVD